MNYGEKRQLNAKHSILLIAAFIFLFFPLFLIHYSLFAAAETSPDAIATRVMPNPDHLSPWRWYQKNNFKGSPQNLTVDGYEAIRDGRTVYVNAANLDLSKNQLYTNIYIISYNQQAQSQTTDIFGQMLAHWKFNTNIPAEQKDKVRQDTKRLADLAEIKSALNNYQKSHSGDFPSLSAGSYVAGKSISVWPSWQATLGKELGVTLPLDPINKLGACPGYDALTCWNQENKTFAGVPAGSRAYIYTYTGKGSYNICGLMASGYLTTLDQGACPGSAVGHTVDNCGSSAAGLGDYHREGSQCVSNKKINDPTCFDEAASYDDGWKSFARIWASGSWQSYCTIFGCKDNFYYENQPWFAGEVKVAQGGCQNCSINPDSGATSVKAKNGCQNTQCANPCEITACASGKHPSSDGLTCLADVLTCSSIQHLSSDGSACESNTASCAVSGGVGEKQWQASTNNWGACQATSCDQPGGYILFSGQCIKCQASDYSGAATVGIDTSGQCKITACESGKTLSSDGLTCEAAAASCTATCNATDEPNCQVSAPVNSETGSGICCGGQICYKCLTNYEWDNISQCKPKTQTVACADKPANTGWNTGATVLQTWAGSAWQPSNSSFYDVTAGICKFKCQAGHNWDSANSKCVSICSTVTCTALDQCHDIGACDPATGVCSNPKKSDNSSCDDVNNCTKNDVCIAGVCKGASYACSAAGECQTANSCDGAGGCTASNKANGTACGVNDGNFYSGSCSSGACDKTCPNTWQKISGTGGAVGKCLLNKYAAKVDWATANAACPAYGGWLPSVADLNSLKCGELVFRPGTGLWGAVKTSDASGGGHKIYADTGNPSSGTCGEYGYVPDSDTSYDYVCLKNQK